MESTAGFIIHVTDVFRSIPRFDENYALASTQSLKNKDIPEGGAKGTILPSLGADPRQCFEKYVDVRLQQVFPLAYH